MLCAVFGCNNNNCKSLKRNKLGLNKNINFHSFPADEEMCKKWVEKCYRSDYINTKFARICSQHFREDHYERDMKHELLNIQPRIRKLKKTAYPTENLPVVDPSSGSESALAATISATEVVHCKKKFALKTPLEQDRREGSSTTPLLTATSLLKMNKDKEMATIKYTKIRKSNTNQWNRPCKVEVNTLDVLEDANLGMAIKEEPKDEEEGGLDLDVGADWSSHPTEVNVDGSPLSPVDDSYGSSPYDENEDDEEEDPLNIDDNYHASSQAPANKSKTSSSLNVFDDEPEWLSKPKRIRKRTAKAIENDENALKRILLKEKKSKRKLTEEFDEDKEFLMSLYPLMKELPVPDKAEFKRTVLGEINRLITKNGIEISGNIPVTGTKSTLQTVTKTGDAATAKNAFITVTNTSDVPKANTTNTVLLTKTPLAYIPVNFPLQNTILTNLDKISPAVRHGTVTVNRPQTITNENNRLLVLNRSLPITMTNSSTDKLTVTNVQASSLRQKMMGSPIYVTSSATVPYTNNQVTSTVTGDSSKITSTIAGSSFHLTDTSLSDAETGVRDVSEEMSERLLDEQTNPEEGQDDESRRENSSNEELVSDITFQEIKIESIKEEPQDTPDDDGSIFAS